jgi:signal-transduction protein with cAMP-binding, CBS, and nucleotidyltransferase domain
VFHDTLKKEKANHLAKFKALKCLPNETLDALVRLIQIKSYHIHEVIYREQQDADYVYFINTGDVELSTSFSSEDMQGNAFTTIIGYSSELMTLLGQKFNSVQIKKAGVGARVRVSVVTSKQVFGWEEIMG